MFQSYSQNGEDILLHRCFGDVAVGFYVDIGASASVTDSVTQAFYERGWRGINVEPLPWHVRELNRYRPRDVNFAGVCREAEGPCTFYAAVGLDGLSSLSHEGAVRTVGEDNVVSMIVQGTTLASLFDKHAPSTVNFLKVDVEGAEAAVLASNDWSRWRPQIVLLEATKPLTQLRSDETCRAILEASGYLYVYFDGLNGYYVSSERSDLAEHFSAPVNFFDNAKRFGCYGSVFDDSRHPDYGWARSFAARFLRFGAALGSDVDFAVLTADLSEDELNRPLGIRQLRDATMKTLSRLPRDDEYAYWLPVDEPAPHLRVLYSALVRCDEFLNRRARAAASA